MKVLYDYQIFDWQKVGGISRYFFELMSAFEKDETISWELPIAYSNNEYLNNFSSFKHLKSKAKPFTIQQFLFRSHFPGKGLLYAFTNKMFPPLAKQQSEQNKAINIKKIKEGNFDVFHPTYYDHYFLDYIGNKPYVLTVYDLIHQIFPEYSLWEPIDKSKELLNRASKIIAISESTKQDLKTIFGIDDSKIVVSYLANSMSTKLHPGTIKMQLPQRYLLFVGYREIYKNFLFFAQAFAIISETEADLFLICTGAAFSKDELMYFDKLGIREKIIHQYVDDAGLAHLYQHAEAFVFPSMYEGFGLPVLEAFACGCPIVISNSSSLPEVGGDAAIYFEPKNISSLVKALLEAVHNNNKKETLIKKGYQQLQKFSWAKTAAITKDVYADVVKNAIK